MKTKSIQKITIVVCLMALGMIFQACMKNNLALKAPNNYTNHKYVESYEDLFKVFWEVMDTRYAYMYEQAEKSGKTWGDVYKEYLPRFQALKTYKPKGFTDNEIDEEREKAIGYFDDIIDPIIDGHFIVRIYLPSSPWGAYRRFNFFQGIKKLREQNALNLETETELAFSVDDKAVYMNNKLDNIYSITRKITSLADLFSGFALSPVIMGGRLRNHPDIHYCQFPNFQLTQNLQLDLQGEYFRPSPDNRYILSVSDIENNEDLRNVTDTTLRERLKRESLVHLTAYNTLYNATEITEFNRQVGIFLETEVVTDRLLSLCSTLKIELELLPSYKGIDMDRYRREQYNRAGGDQNARRFINWFITRLIEHNDLAYGLEVLESDLEDITRVGEVYKKLLNPLHNGQIGKLILDLRNNGGGAVVDARFFIDRLIAQEAIYCYSRYKEGNTRYSYTPWLPVRTQLHRFGIPRNIPIAILTNSGSFSMSEISTMMLKSQGSQVFTVGTTTGGGTSGLGPNESFNAGSFSDNIASALSFYMPLLASKDPEGNIIDGVGISPNIHVDAPTQEEIDRMRSNPTEDNIDRALARAIQELSNR